MTAAYSIPAQERHERRAAHRLAHEGAVECDISGERVLDYLANISVGGVAIRANRLRAPLGAPIILRFRIPGMPSKSELHGWVVRTDIDEEGATVAVRFADLSLAVQHALQLLSQP